MRLGTNTEGTVSTSDIAMFSAKCGHGHCGSLNRCAMRHELTITNTGDEAMKTYRLNRELHDEVTCWWCAEPLLHGDLVYKYDEDADTVCSPTCATALHASQVRRKGDRDNEQAAL